MAISVNTSASRHIDIVLLYLRNHGFIIQRDYDLIEDEMRIGIKYPDGSKCLYKGKMV